MGIPKVTVQVSNLAKTKKPHKAEFLVDTGAADCMAPAEALKKAGIAVEGEAIYELANGEEIKYPYGFARLSFMGDETIARVIFGPSQCEPLLGVIALESVGIMVDSLSQTLKRLATRPLK